LASGESLLFMGTYGWYENCRVRLKNLDFPPDSCWRHAAPAGGP